LKNRRKKFNSSRK